MGERRHLSVPPTAGPPLRLGLQPSHALMPELHHPHATLLLPAATSSSYGSTRATSAFTSGAAGPLLLLGGRLLSPPPPDPPSTFLPTPSFYLAPNNHSRRSAPMSLSSWPVPRPPLPSVLIPALPLLSSLPNSIIKNI